MVKMYNCSCNRNMYLWWCSNVYIIKRLQSFIWRYFYSASLGSSLGIDSNVQTGVEKFGCIWLECFARGQGIWLKFFEKSQIPTLCPASPPPPPPPPPRQHYIDRCINSTTFCINFHFFGEGQSIQLSALLHDIRLKKFKGIQTK